MALARSENGVVPVNEARTGAKNSIKIAIPIKEIPKKNQIFFQMLSEIIFIFHLFFLILLFRKIITLKLNLTIDVIDNKKNLKILM